jgi:general L-amino acid transport system substrate-binding protein
VFAIKTRLPLVIAACAMATSVTTVSAGPVLDRVRASGAIRCGAVARPGLLGRGDGGTANGLFVDLCRAVGVAAAGPSVTVRMTFYDSDKAFDEVRAGRDDLYFLSGAEIADQKLAGIVVPGPAAFYETVAVMTAGASKAERPADLQGQSICFLQGDVSHRSIEAYFAARRLSFVRMGYREEEELYDAFGAQQCQGLAGEATTLAEVRREGGEVRRGGRILSEPLATFPILATTSPGDGAWSALAFWTLALLIDAGRPKQDWAAGGLDSLPIDMAALGLAAGWREKALAAVGSYIEIYRRNVGEASPFHLPTGPNALAGEGGLMAPPYAE